jgi:hypothetical protein
VLAGVDLVAMFTCRVISFWVLLDGRPFWIMFNAPLAGRYSSFWFLLAAGCGWIVIVVGADSGGGGGALSAKVPGASLNPWLAALLCIVGSLQPQESSTIFHEVIISPPTFRVDVKVHVAWSIEHLFRKMFEVLWGSRPACWLAEPGLNPVASEVPTIAVFALLILLADEASRHLVESIVIVVVAASPSPAVIVVSEAIFFG